MLKPLVILGSARRDGQTRRAIDIAFAEDEANLIVLNDLNFSGFDYSHTNTGDDFSSVIDAMLVTPTIVLATPVYWYSMSAPLKTFFDRLSDLLEIAKDKGRALGGKNLWLLVTGTEEVLPEGFEVPFRRTADYFAMGFQGTAYLYTGADHEAVQRSQADVLRFGRDVLKSHLTDAIQPVRHPGCA